MKTRAFLSILCSVLMVLVGCQKEPIENLLIEDTVHQARKGGLLFTTCEKSELPFYIIKGAISSHIYIIENDEYVGFFNNEFNYDGADWIVEPYGMFEPIQHDNTTEISCFLAQGGIHQIPLPDCKITISIPRSNIEINDPHIAQFCFIGGKLDVTCSHSNTFACGVGNTGGVAMVVIP